MYTKNIIFYLLTYLLTYYTHPLPFSASLNKWRDHRTRNKPYICGGVWVRK